MPKEIMQHKKFILCAADFL